MNLRKAMFWKGPAAAGNTSNVAQLVAKSSQTLGSLTPPRGSEASPSSTVIPLTRPAAAENLPPSDEFVIAPANSARIKGLMNAPELEAFFNTNQFGYGRHHGSHYRTQEALERGIVALVSNFQNIACDLAERRQARVGKLQQSHQEVATLSPAIAETLSLACDQTQREIVVLTEQTALAEQRKGWVLDVLNRYQLGFDRGVREALDFELLNA